MGRIPSESGDNATQDSQASDTLDMASETSKDDGDEPPTTPTPSEGPTSSKPRRPTKGSEPFEKWEREEMEKLLGQLNGHLGRNSSSNSNSIIHRLHSRLPKQVFGRRRHRQQLSFQRRSVSSFFDVFLLRAEASVKYAVFFLYLFTTNIHGQLTYSHSGETSWRIACSL